MKSSLGLLFVLLWALTASAEVDHGDLVRQLGSPSPEVRTAAAERLRSSGAAAASALISGLGSGDALVALGCADLIGAGRFREARGALREILAREDAPRLLVRAACRALGACGDYRDLELLGAIAPTLGEAALALAEIGEPEAREILAAIAPAESAPLEVAYALARLGDLSGVPRLISALEGPVGEALAAGLYLRRIAGREVGATAAEWRVWLRREQLAGRLGAPDWESSEKALAEVRGKDGRLDPDLRADLLAIAGDGAYARYARTKSILALGLCGDRDLTGPLVEILNGDPEPNVRLYAAEALGRLGDPAVAVDLTWYLVFDEEPFRKLSSKDLTVEYVTIDSEVCRSLLRLGIAGGLDYMIRQLGQQHRVRVYHQAMMALRKVTGQNFDYRADGNRGFRARVANRWRLWFDENRESLPLEGPARQGSPLLQKRIGELVDTLGHYKFLTMSRALESLVLLGEVATPQLVAGLERPELHIRAHCAQILGRIHAKSAREAVARRLGDPRAEVRTAAAAALADMGPGVASEAVEAALLDPVAGVRIEAARALARAEAAVARKALGAAMAREENALPAFQREAWFALAAHGDAGAVDRLVELLGRTGEGVPFVRSVEDRLARLTGRAAGPGEGERQAFLEWWKVSRESYSPEYPFGKNGNAVTPR